ncbi:MAG TPA: hypothetical protein VGH83_03490 [Candidatus Acidoferrum sp.]|jgi:type IV secretion system protein VirB10
MKRRPSDRPISVIFSGAALCIGMVILLPQTFAQQSDGPQTSAPPPVARPAKPAAPRNGESAEKITVPAGTRMAVVLENGISTRNAKAGDSVYLRTSFPITQNNRVVIPIGSYVRGELLDSKRPGRIKGRGEFRMLLTTLIFPNGYTVNLIGAPRTADSGGGETTDSEGKVTGPGGKGKDAATVATTTVAGTGIGAIAGGAKGAGIGAGAGGLAGLAAVLLTRGPEAQLPRGSTLDVVLEHDLSLEGDQIRFTDVGNSSPITPPPGREQ